MLKWLRVALLAVPRLVLDYFRYILPYSRHPERYPLEVRWHNLSRLIRYVMWCFHIDLIAPGLKEFHERELRGERIVLMPNHISDLDPLIYIALSSKPIRPVSKIEAKKYPLIGRAVTALDGIFLDRGDLRQSLAVIKEMSEGLEQGKNYLIFPEGTRNKKWPETLLLPLHPGSFKAAQRGKATCIPSSIAGTSMVFKTDTSYSRYPVYVSYLDPIDVESQGTDAISAEATSKIEKSLAASLTKEKAYFEAGEHKKKWHKQRY